MDVEEFASDHDETGEWLWDLEDRYDLGSPEEQLPATLAAASFDPRVLGLKKRLRTPNGDESPVAEAAPTSAVAALEPFEGGDEDWDDSTGPVPMFADDAPRHFTPSRGGIWGISIGVAGAIAAAIVVVLGVVGILVSRQGGGSHQSSGVAIGTPKSSTTLGPAVFGVITTQPPTSDTTATTLPGATTTVAPATTTIPAFGVTSTFPFISFPTTVPTRTTQPPTPPTNPPPTTAPPPTTTPPTTTPPTTVPPTTVPPTTTPPTTTPPTTTPPTTSPPTT